MSGFYSQTIVAPGAHLERDLVRGPIALAHNATYTYDVETAHTNWIEVQGQLNATVTTTDLTVTVAPFEDDGVTLNPQVLPVDTSTGAQAGVTSDGVNIHYVNRFSVIGVSRVRITWKNANAGSKNLVNASWRTESYAGR